MCVRSFPALVLKMIEAGEASTASSSISNPVTSNAVISNPVTFAICPPEDEDLEEDFGSDIGSPRDESNQGTVGET